MKKIQRMLLCLSSALCLWCNGCSREMDYPRSDHFDGKKFFNPTHPESVHLTDVVKLFTTTKWSKWPKQVKNFPLLNLSYPLANDQVAVTFVNHATFLIQIPKLNILTDPIWSERASPFSWIGPKRVRAPGIAFNELPVIDVVLISHNHYDHLDIPTIKKLNEKFHPKFIVPLGNQYLLKKNKIDNVIEIDWWDGVRINPNIEIFSVPVQHFSARGLFDRYRALWSGYVIRFNNHQIYFAGDAAYSSHFRVTQERLGSLDLAFLPIGAYEPRWFMKQVHMNPEEAIKAHLDLRANQSIGFHFGTFQLSAEGIDQPLKDLSIALKKMHLINDRLMILGEGRTHIFDFAKK